MKFDPEKKRPAAPLARKIADEHMPMDPRRQSQEPPVGPEERMLDELSRWDELSPGRLAELEVDPAHGPRLELLRRVETILEIAIGAQGGCPEPEELYDYGRGPGYEPLEPDRRRSIELHLDRCSECAGQVRSLAASPPLPLDVTPPADLRPGHRPTQVPVRAPLPGIAHDEEDPAGPFATFPIAETHRGRKARAAAPRSEDPFAESQAPHWAAAGERDARRADLGPHWSGDRARRRSRPAGLRTLVAMGAAAGLLVLLWPEGPLPAAEPLGGALPSSQVLRGDAGGPLYFPRGKVLSPPLGLGAGASRIEYAEQPLFEIEAVERASLYRVTVRRHDGGVFAEGRQIQHLESSDGPALRAERPLGPGFYTWEAWAIVDGLDQHLGERDFEIVQDDALCREIEGLDDKAAIRGLHEAGFLTDARALARRLPPSDERDAYLRALPGR